jgi:hypothetical protein
MSSLAHGSLNYQIYRTLTYYNQRIHIYKSMSGEDTDPKSWSFYYIPAMLPDFSIENQWIWTVKSDVRVNLIFGNDDITSRARDAIAKRAGAQGKDDWSVEPIIIDSFTAYVVSGTNNIVPGTNPFYIVNPSSTNMVFKFQCSSAESATDVRTKIFDGDYQIEILFNFAGWNQITTNMVSVTSDTIKKVISKTLADGGNTRAQYIHRQQNNSFVEKYMTNIKKTMYIENPNVDLTTITNGLNDELKSLMQEGNLKSLRFFERKVMQYG